MKVRHLGKQKYEGLGKQNFKFVPTGYKTLDEGINDLMSKTVTVITGRPGEGKSTFVHSCMLNAIDKGYKVFLLDGEHSQEKLLHDLFKKVIGNEYRLYDNRRFNKKMLIEPKKHIQEMLNVWIKDLHICSKYENDLSNFDLIFDLLKLYIRTEKIDVIFLDNIMSLIDSTQTEMNARQSKFMKNCTSLAKAANVPIVIVGHPNGTAVKGQKIDYYQISGTSDIPNLADVVIQVVKDPLSEDGQKLADGRLYVLKGRHYSIEQGIDLVYDNDTSSLCEITGESYEPTKYNWRKEGNQNVITGD